MTNGISSIIIWLSGILGGIIMVIKTRIFELCNGRYSNLSELARVMEISVSQIYRVREGKRHINQKFLIGAIKAFPEHKLDDLFYFTDEWTTVTHHCQQTQVLTSPETS